MARLAALQGTQLGTPVSGEPTCLREGVVRTINTDGTLGAVARIGRKSWEGLRVPRWYHAKLGDLVLVGNIDGSPQRPVVLCPLSTSANVAPITAKFTAAETWSFSGASIATGEALGARVLLTPGESQKIVGFGHYALEGEAEVEVVKVGGPVLATITVKTEDGYTALAEAHTRISGERLLLKVKTSTLKKAAAIDTIVEREA